MGLGCGERGVGKGWGEGCGEGVWGRGPCVQCVEQGVSGVESVGGVFEAESLELGRLVYSVWGGSQ